MQLMTSKIPIAPHLMQQKAEQKLRAMGIN